MARAETGSAGIVNPAERPADVSDAERILQDLAAVFFPTEDAAAHARDENRKIEAIESPYLETRYQILVEQIPAVVFLAFLDRDLSEAYVSPQIERLLGFKQEEWLHDPVRWYKHIHPDDKDRWSIEAAQMFLTGEPLRSVYRALARDGRVRWFHCEAKMVRRHDGRPWFIHGVAFDITEQKEAEAALRAAHDELEQRVRDRTRALAEANQELESEILQRKSAEQEREALLGREREARQQAEDANRLKDEFLATVSHELRTPITAIVGWSQLLRVGRLDPSQTERALEVIERNARLQTRLIDDLLDISRTIAGKLRLNIAWVNPTPVIEAAVDSVLPAANAKNITVNVDLDPAVSQVRADPDRFQQIVWNLLTNAIKFTPPQGRVDLALRRDGTDIEVVVRDTGEGISAEFLPFVFDRFRQADGSVNRARGGLGLGLAIVRHLTELHGGTVSARSAGEGQGSTFTVRLPATRRLAQENANGSKELLADVRILLVDDQPDILELFQTALQRYGANVVAVAGGEAALDALRHHAVDVIIADIQMPGVDGYQLMNRIRALDDPQVALVPAIAVTAYADRTDRTRALKAGYQEQISKPVDPHELAMLVASIARPNDAG